MSVLAFDRLRTPIFPTRLLGLAIDAIADGSLTPTRLTLYAGGILLILLGNYFINIAYHYTINTLGHEQSYRNREKYISHLFELDSGFYEKYTKGDLIARAGNDLQTLTTLATSFLQAIVFNSIYLLAALVMMVIINPLLILASASFMPVAVFWLNRSVSRSAGITDPPRDLRRHDGKRPRINRGSQDGPRLRHRGDGFEKTRRRSIATSTHGGRS